MSHFRYIRVSSDKQDADKQHHLLLDYAQSHGFVIDEFAEIEITSRKSARERRIDELYEKLTSGDTLIVAKLSRLGRNMPETMNIITRLSDAGVQIVFVRQPELSTNGPHGKLLLAIYSYFAEAERDFISMRTKQGLAAVKASGKKLGRRKVQRNKHRVLDDHREKIRVFLSKGVDLANIRKLINPDLDKPISYTSYKYFVEHDAELLKLWKG